MHPLARPALVSLVALAGALPATARAQGSAPLPVADSAATLTFDLPAQPLRDALAAFAHATGARVVVDARALAGRQSAAVSGRYTPAEALRLLLAGTELSGRMADARTAVIGEAPAARHELARVRVTARQGRAAGYGVARSSTATKTDTPLLDTPQAVTVVSRALIADQAMQGMADVVRYVPGVTMGLGEGHRDAPTIRGNASTADFFVDGVRDDAQYLRDLYNVERVEALKGANAMVFGRGGGGGVINRVDKAAEWAPTRAVTAEGGSWDHRRATLDAGQGFGGHVAARVNAVAERSGGFRDAARLERQGVNPTLALAAGATVVRVGYEWFRDARTVDRGIPSSGGRPLADATTTFFGNPDVNVSRASVQSGTATVTHEAGRLRVVNRTRLADYDKFYQNSFPGAVNAAGTGVALSAYNHAIRRHNLINQTEATLSLGGAVGQLLLAGAEVGRQVTDQLRNTGYFGGTATTVTAPLAAPTVATPVEFRQSATDADNRATARTGAVYAQDQLSLGAHLRAVVGLRAERFGIAYRNHRTGQTLSRDDHLVSPRAGLVLRPTAPLSFYGSYAVSYLPSSGDQFTTLTVTTAALEPERFTNRELGARWDALPGLSLSAAAYRLDRTNSAAVDPADPSRTVQTGRQRTSGVELGLAGDVTSRWQIAGGATAQRARIVRATSAARAGASVPLVPARTLSLWNRYQAIRALGLGLGVVHQGAVYAAIDNSVTLPRYTRLDGALFLTPLRTVRAQLNVENLAGARYWATSQGNNNIMPGAPRTVRLSLSTTF